MIRVRCNLHSYLIKYIKDETSNFEVELKEGSNVIDLLEKIDIPKKKARLIFINGIQRKKITMLDNGDEIKIIPFIPGG